MALTGWSDRRSEVRPRRLAPGVRKAVWVAAASSGWLAGLWVPASAAAPATRAASLTMASGAADAPQPAAPEEVRRAGRVLAANLAGKPGDSAAREPLACHPCPGTQIADREGRATAPTDQESLVPGYLDAVCVGPRRSHPGVIKIEQGKAKTVGNCQMDDIRKNLRARAATFRACYEDEREKAPGLAGTLLLEWVINGEGRVQGESIAKDDMGSGAVRECVLRVARRISYMRPDVGNCWTQWKLQFKPEVTRPSVGCGGC